MRVHGCGVDFIDLKVFCIFFSTILSLRLNVMLGIIFN